MYQVDEKPETIHLYVVREKVARPSLLPIILSVLALSILIALGVLIPYQQPVIRASLRVPAVFLPLKTFTAQASIIPTGIKTYPATTAHGMLTITNGSVISATLPQGLIISGVVLDTSVFVPAGSANGFGVATVSAHSLVSGKGGNIAILTINNVVNSSIYIRNLQPFHGGQNAYSVTFTTATDRANALESARTRLKAQTIAGILYHPCTESNNGNSRSLKVTWLCQFVTYHIPAFYHVTGVKIQGKNLIVDVWFVARPKRFQTK
jgi:hypothetical protein